MICLDSICALRQTGCVSSLFVASSAAAAALPGSSEGSDDTLSKRFLICYTAHLGQLEGPCLVLSGFSFSFGGHGGTVPQRRAISRLTADVLKYPRMFVVRSPKRLLCCLQAALTLSEKSIVALKSACG